MSDHRPPDGADTHGGLSDSALHASMLLVPYIITTHHIQQLIAGGDLTVEAFLARQHQLIERSWNRHGNATAVLYATRSLLDKVEDALPPCRSMASLLVLEAKALLAAAPTPDLVKRAKISAERALETIGMLTEVHDLELLNDALLLSAVASKALGDPDDCIAIVRTGIREWDLDEVSGVALGRQEVMVTQDMKRHVQILDEAPFYADHRPSEYFRTLKRVMEYLMNRGAYREAEKLAPVTGRAFMAAISSLSFIARLSFIKNLGQLHVSVGQVDRGVRFLGLARRMASKADFEGQLRQINTLLMATRDDVKPQLRTFRVHST